MPSPRITIRLSADMHAALTARAAESGQELSEHIRSTLARSLKMPAPKMVGGLGGLTDEERSEIGRLGADARWKG